MNHFFSALINITYEEFGRHFPGLNANPDPEVGLRELESTSLYYRRTKEFCTAVLGGREKDIQAAEDMYENDLVAVLTACPPQPTGYRLGAYMCVAWEIGKRPAMFLLSFPDHVHQLPNGGWRFDGLYDVKTNNRYHDYTLGARAGEWVGLFKNCEDMRDWAIANTAFHYSSVEALDMEINEYVEKSGHLSWLFSSYSLRRGCFNQKLGNLILVDGLTREEAVRRVTMEFGWATAGDTGQDYLSPLGTFENDVINYLS